MKFVEKCSQDFSPEQVENLVAQMLPLVAGQKFDIAGMNAAFAAFNEIRKGN